MKRSRGNLSRGALESLAWAGSARRALAVRCAACLLALWAPQAGANLVLDANLTGLSSLFPDALSTGAVFSRYGQDPWGGDGTFGYSEGDFLGPEFLVPFDKIGGIDGEFGAEFGAEVGFGVNGKIGAEYAFALSGGALDIRYPVQVNLDLPYGPGGTGAPEIGDAFTIASSWGVATQQILGSPGASGLTPLLAAHGPFLQAYVDLLAKFGVALQAKLCFVGCVGAGFEFGFEERYELAGVNRAGDGAVSVAGQTVSPATPGELLGGILQYYLNNPTLDAVGGLEADNKTLSASTADQLAGIGLGIDELISAIFLGGFPLSDSFGINIAGKHIGVGYNILDASAWLNLLLAQQFQFSGVPFIELAFGAPVQVRQADGSWSADTQKVVFNAGESVELRAPGAQILGVIPTFGLAGNAANDTGFDFQGQVNVSALGLTSPLGDVGPLFQGSVDFPIGGLSVFNDTFAVNMDKIVGGAFNMAFLPNTVHTQGSMTPVMAFWDTEQWPDSPDGCALDVCSFLPQSQVLGFYDLGTDERLVRCTLAGTCDWEVLAQFIDPDLLFDRQLTSPRLWGEETTEVFLGELAALFDPLLLVQLDVDPVDIEAQIAAQREGFGPRPMVVPPAPVPEPGSLALLALAIPLVAMSRRRAPRHTGR